MLTLKKPLKPIVIYKNAWLLEAPALQLLAEEFGTPLFVFWEERLWQNVAELREGLGLLESNFRLFYACKANANLSILRTLLEAGLDLEVNSVGELWKGLKAGYKPQQIIFNGVGKSERELKEAILQGIHCINVDSLSELMDIVHIASRYRKDVRIALRLVPEIKDGGLEGLETGHSQTKFGLPPSQLPEICKVLKDHPYVHLSGLHTHVGSQLSNPVSYRLALERLLGLRKKLEKALKTEIKHLNLGGGLPVEYRHEAYPQKAPCPGPDKSFAQSFGPKEMALVLKDVVPQDILLYFEPGRRLVGNTAFLLTRVVRKKTISARTAPWLILDAGFNVLLEALSYRWYFHLIAAERPQAPHNTGYFVAGPLCDGGDIFPIPHTNCPFYHRLLPENVEEGELLAFLDTGAYTLEQMTYYNGRLPAAAVLIDRKGQIRLIRKRETSQALWANDL